jgi:hypothetical protein
VESNPTRGSNVILFGWFSLDGRRVHGQDSSGILDRMNRSGRLKEKFDHPLDPEGIHGRLFHSLRKLQLPPARWFARALAVTILQFIFVASLVVVIFLILDSKWSGVAKGGCILALIIPAGLILDRLPKFSDLG